LLSVPAYLSLERNTLELSREMKILETNIHLLTRCLLDEANTAAEVLVEGIDRYAPEGAIAGSYCFHCAPAWIQNSQIFESLQVYLFAIIWMLPRRVGG
jgi:hypothetical protein